ncbi:MAG: KR domain-containing protein, partial [Mycobacterium sp.]
NVRQPARFTQAVTAAGQNHGIFIEVSPHPILRHAITESLEPAHHHSIATLWRDGDDTLDFHTSLNAAHTTCLPETPHPAGPHPVLPSTPWQQTRHWMPVKDGVTALEAAPQAGTLIGAHTVVASTPPIHLWQARLTPGAAPYPGSHRHHGVELIPASVLLQTLSTAAAQCDAPVLADVRLEHPIVVDQPRIIQVVTDGESITVSSRPADASPEHRWVKHASAQVVRAPHDHETPPTEGAAVQGGGDDHDISGDGNEFTDESITSLWQAWGSEGRPFGWSIGTCRSARGVLRADVELPASSTVGLLDAALHVARLVDNSSPQLLVAASAEQVRFEAELTDRHGYIEVYRRSGNDDELVVDVAVKAPDGKTCIDIRALRYAAVGSGTTGGADPRTLAQTIEWQPWDRPAHQSIETLCTVAVVGDGVGARVLRDQLVSIGHQPTDIAEAQAVLYIAEPDETESDIDCAVRLSSDVIALVRRLVQRDDNPPRLWIITRGVREAASDAAVRQSCLWGLAGVIRAEQPQLCGGLVDIPAGRDDALDTADAEGLADYVPALSTMLHASAKSILALRDGGFFVPTLAPVSGDPVREAMRCHSDATYLITGGMGALGLLMAGWLADLGARRLLLVGRTPMPPRRDWGSDTNDADVRHKVAAIRALERRGVSVDVAALDIGSRDAIQAMLAARDEHGVPPVRGVIHAAGLTDAQLLTQVEDSRLQRIMWPKIAGAQVLNEAFPPGSLDFFFLTAAAGAVFGVPGQGAYAAANAYLDGLGRARHRQGCHTVSLDWVAWQGLGFATDAQVAVQELERMGSRPITPDEAFAAWEHLDRYDVGQAVMAPRASPDGGEVADPDGAAPARAWSQMPAEDVHSELEVGLRTILARELRMSEAELDLDRPFAELGLNSVMAMTVRRETERFVGTELSATMLWNYPTIAGLAAYLAKKLLPQENSVDNLEALTDSDSSVLSELFDNVESAPAGLDGI